MASAKPASTVRGREGRVGSGDGGAGGGGAGGSRQVSRARWGGVSLVIAALLGTITLAVVSPSQGDRPALPGVAGADGTPAPEATPVDGRLPVGQPRIASPKEGWVIGEWYIDVDVEVPEEPLPKRSLELVILRAGEEVKSLPRPDSSRTATVTDVPLVEGRNMLTAALRGPGGLGPESDPVTVTQDRDAPVLDVTGPRDGTETFDSEVMLTGTSEPGASVMVANATKAWDGELVVGPSGSFEVVVPLALGKNRIVASSTDSAGMERKDSISVQRKDGRPVVKITAPRRVPRAELPKDVRVVIDVSDVDGKVIEGATVSFHLGGPGWTAEDFVDETDASGRSVWQVEIAAGGSQSDPIVSVEVIAPNRERSEAFQEIVIS